MSQFACVLREFYGCHGNIRLTVRSLLLNPNIRVSSLHPKLSAVRKAIHKYFAPEWKWLKRVVWGKKDKEESRGLERW